MKPKLHSADISGWSSDFVIADQAVTAKSASGTVVLPRIVLVRATDSVPSSVGGSGGRGGMSQSFTFSPSIVIPPFCIGDELLGVLFRFSL